MNLIEYLVISRERGKNNTPPPNYNGDIESVAHHACIILWALNLYG